MLESDRFASLVTAIGSDSFGGSVLGLIDPKLDFSHCAAFEQVGEAPPRCITVAGCGDSGAEFARSLTPKYVSEWYGADPTLQLLHKTDAPGISVRFLDGRQLPKSEFVEKFYHEPGLSHEAVLCSRSGAKMTWLGLYKRAGSRGFDDRERRAVQQLTRLLLSSVQKHSEVALRHEPVPDGSEGTLTTWGTTRAELLAKVRGSLLLGPQRLTVREADICAHIVLGYATLAISLNMGISVNTVATHRKRAYAKLGVSSQTELFSTCLRAGLLKSG